MRKDLASQPPSPLPIQKIRGKEGKGKKKGKEQIKGKNIEEEEKKRRGIYQLQFPRQQVLGRGGGGKCLLPPPPQPPLKKDRRKEKGKR